MGKYLLLSYHFSVNLTEPSLSYLFPPQLRSACQPLPCSSAALHLWQRGVREGEQCEDEDEDEDKGWSGQAHCWPAQADPHLHQERVQKHSGKERGGG
jgi:hypothetical protein